MIDYFTKHFLALSSAALVASAAISMVVISSYLSVFDSSLIWLIEYSDITKLFLIGAALISSFATTILYQSQDIYLWLIRQSKQWKRIVLFGVALTVLINGTLVYFDIRSGSTRINYDVFRGLSSLTFVFLLYTIFNDYTRYMQGNWIAISNAAAFFTIFLGLVGATYGYHVKDVGTTSREIWTRNEHFSNAKIIMLLSHHIAFLENDSVIVLPTADVARIISKPASVPAQAKQ